MSEVQTSRLGVDTTSGNEAIGKAAFDCVQQIGHMVIATIGLDKKTPTTRAIEVHYLDDAGGLYIGLSEGKPFYFEMKANPRISCGITRIGPGRLGLGVRINAEVAEVDPAVEPKIYERYWAQNKGTAALYRRNLDNFRIFRLTRGEGELFELPEDDLVIRLRFAFGGARPRPWYYTINEKCTGCGTCKEKCMTQVISMENGKACINHHDCLECGVCYDVCPSKAIDRNDW